jgi:hypothetical protein
VLRVTWQGGYRKQRKALSTTLVQACTYCSEKDLFVLREYMIWDSGYVRVVNCVFQERYPAGCNKKKNWRCVITWEAPRNFQDFQDFRDFRDFPGFPGISSGFRGEIRGVFLWFQAVITCKPLKNGRFSGDDFRDFPEFPEFPENFRKIPEFRNFGNPKNSRNFRKFPATGFFRNFLYFFIFYALWRRVRDYKKL